MSNSYLTRVRAPGTGGQAFEWVHVDTRGIDIVVDTFKKRGQRFVADTAKEMTKEMKDGMQELGGARSKPGEFPAVQTGLLRKSIKQTMEGHLHYDISDAPAEDGRLYGFYLEMGTSRMAARPWMIPIFTRWQNGEFLRFAKRFDWNMG